MNKILFIFLSLIFLVAGRGTACAAVRDMKVVDAELDRYMLVPAVSVPAPVAEQSGLPRWKASLSEIQDTAASLLSANTQLTAENQALTAQAVN
ncbi:MAG: hypothetical protein WCI27_09920, partial [Candidatus Omnitrophota bacterium]